MLLLKTQRFNNIHTLNPFQLTCVTSHMDLETTGLVICLVTAWEGAAELTCFFEVSAVVGVEGTEGDEGLLTTCIEHEGIVSRQ